MCSETKSSQHTNVKPTLKGEKRLEALSEAEGRCVVGIWHVATCLVDEEWEQRGKNAWFKVPKLRPVSGN